MTHVYRDKVVGIKRGECQVTGVTHSCDILVKMDWKTRTVVIGFGRLQKTVCRWIQIDTELHQSIRSQSDNIRRWKVSSSYKAVANFLSTSLRLRRHTETAAVRNNITITPCALKCPLKCLYLCCCLY